MDFQNEEFEIDLLELFNYLKKKILIITAAVLACAFIGLIFTMCFMAPEYTAATRMYVLNRSSETLISSSDYSVSNYMVSDYEVLITGENVTKEVINQLGLNMTTAELTGKISVEAIDNTRVLQIKAVDTNAKRAADIANSVREVASVQIKEIMDVDAVNLVYEAATPEKKSGPSLTKNTIIAAALGMIASVGIFAVIFIMDDTIRNEEDVERYLGLGTLGIIPASKDFDVVVVKKAKRKKKTTLFSKKSAKTEQAVK